MSVAPSSGHASRSSQTVTLLDMHILIRPAGLRPGNHLEHLLDAELRCEAAFAGALTAIPGGYPAAAVASDSLEMFFLPRSLADLYRLQREYLWSALREKEMQVEGLTGAQRFNHAVFFAPPGAELLARKSLAILGAQLSPLKHEWFRDGELDVSLGSTVQNREVVLIHSTHYPQDEHINQLCYMADAAKRAGASHITAVVPYLGYARKDRRDEERSTIAVANVIQRLEASGIYRLIFIDMHNPTQEGLFNGPCYNLYASSVFVPYLQHMLGDSISECGIASADLGGAKRARGYRTLFGISSENFWIIDKERSTADQVGSVRLLGEADRLRNRTVLLLDDLISTGGTIIEGAKLLKSQGAKQVIVCATHGHFLQSAYFALREAEWAGARAIDKLIVSDTIPQVFPVDEFLHRVSVAPLIAAAIRECFGGALPSSGTLPDDSKAGLTRLKKHRFTVEEITLPYAYTK